jgi:hypothetical protein
LKNRKGTDLLILLLISVFVVSASAAIYYSMYAKSTTTITAAPVYFTPGGDSSGILKIGTNSTYAELNLNAYPNVTLYYDQAVNITASAAGQVQLDPVSVSPNDLSVSNFTSIVFTLVRADGSEVGSLTYTTTGNTWNIPAPSGYVSISAGETIAVKVAITAVAGAKAGVSTAIVLTIDVKQ